MSFKWLWLPLTVLLMSACGGSGGGSDEPQDNTPTNAVVKFVATSANAPSYSVLVLADREEDIDVDDSAEGETGNTDDDEEEGVPIPDMTYGAAMAFSTSPTTLQFKVRYALPAGPTSGPSHAQAMAPFNLNAVRGNRYEIYLGGSHGAAERWMLTTPLLFEESESQARLTVVHAAPGAPSLDVHLTGVDAPIDSSTLLSTLAYKDGDNSLRIDPASYRIRITEVGSSTVIFTSDTIAFAKGNDINLTVIDNAWVKPGVTGKSPIAISRSATAGSSRVRCDANAGADIRFIHSSLDAGLLDVMMDENFDQPMAEDFDLGEVTPYQSVSSGIHNFKVVPANGATAVIDANHNLFNGVAWAMYIMRPWASIDPLFVSENARPIAAHARLRLVHGSSSSGNVDVYITKEGADLGEVKDGKKVYLPVGTNLSQRRATSYLSLMAGTYSITLTRTPAASDPPLSSPQVIYGPVTVTLANNEIYTMLFRNQASGSLTHQWVDGTPAVVE